MLQPKNINIEQHTVQSHQITSTLEPKIDKKDFKEKSLYFSNPVQDPDLSPYLDPDTFRFIGRMYNEDGTFEWSEKKNEV